MQKQVCEPSVMPAFEKVQLSLSAVLGVLGFPTAVILSSSSHVESNQDGGF